MVVSLEQFLEWLAESGLLPEADVRELLDSMPASAQPKDGKELAQLLTERNKLTGYQAQQILGGNGTSLVFENYVVVDKLGQGGMGLVFKAEHRRMERTVALKILSPDLTQTAETLKRFQREVKTAAKLQHPNIVTAYDADEANGTHFLVMQFVDGTDLSVLVKRNGPLPVDQAVGFVLQVARGLEYAHAHGVIHRDIKPGNMLVDQNGTVKILDMGLARLDCPDAQPDELTGSGRIMGTVDYMAPEQALDARTVDVRADIYSLGITMWYLLTGRPAYAGDTVLKKLMAHRDEPIPSLAKTRPDVCNELDVVFAKMIAKAPAARYQTMTEVIESVEQLAACRPVSSDAGSAGMQVTASFHRSQAEAVDRSSRWKKASTWLAVGTAVVLLLVPVILFLDRSDPSAGWAGWPPDAPAPAIAPFDAATAKQHQQAWAAYLGVPVEYKNSIGMSFRLIPPGEFMMGSTQEEIVEVLKLGERRDAQWHANVLGESPRHLVRLTRPFYLSVHEVTRGQYRNTLQSVPAGGKQTASHPIGASWFDSVRFCNELGRRESLKPCYSIRDTSVMIIDDSGYRLPTEAEWEFSCRAGAETRYYFGNDSLLLSKHAWFLDHPDRETHPVGMRLPNAFGLFDLYGNAWEWCHDWHHPKYYQNLATNPVIDPTGPQTGLEEQKITRGGSCFFGPWHLRSAYRGRQDPSTTAFDQGFRAVLSVDAVRNAQGNPEVEIGG